MKNQLRNIHFLTRSLPWRIAEKSGGWSSNGAPIQFVIEQADWAIRWVGENIQKQLNKKSPNLVETTLSPQKFTNRVIHFGSQYMWLNWNKYLSGSNHYVCSFFHGKIEDGPVVAEHIDKFMATVPMLSKVVTGATIVEERLINWGVPPEKLVRIPIGVDTQVFQPPDLEKRKSSRIRFGIPDEAFVIGSFQKDGQGWGDGLKPKFIKGPDILVEVLIKLRDSGIPIIAFLTGPSRGFVKEKLRENGIQFIHKYVEKQSELVECYHTLDMYMVTSREEGGPMGLLESMACGVPVVSTPVGMAPDLLRNNLINGLALNCSSEEILKETHKILDLNKYQLANRKIQTRKAIQYLDWSIVSQQHWNSVYKPLIKE